MSIYSYCVAIAAPDRKRRLREAFQHVDASSNKTRCELVPFLYMLDKQWTVWLDIIPAHRLEDVTANRLRQGFKQLTQTVTVVTQLYKDEEGRVNARKSRGNKSFMNEMDTANGVDIVNGEILAAEIDGDVSVCRGDEDTGGVPAAAPDMSLVYHDKLPENYRQWNVAPLSSSDGMPKPSLKVVILRDAIRLRTYKFELSPEAVRAYHYVEPVEQPPEPVKESVSNDRDDTADRRPVTAPARTTSSIVRPPTASFLRLCKLTKPPREGKFSFRYLH